MDGCPDGGLPLEAACQLSASQPISSGGGNGNLPRPPPVYSDALYYRHMSATLPLDPAWLSVDTIPRRHHTQLSPAAFIAEFESANVPVVISGGCAHWPALRNVASGWSRDALTRNHGDTAFTVGGYEMRLNPEP